MTDVRDSTRGTRRRAIVIGAVVPLVIAVAGAVLMLGWLPQLPDPVVTHWSGSVPDGYGPAWLLALTPLGIVVLFSAFAIGLSSTPTARGLLTVNQKFLLVTGIWLSTFLTVGVAGSLWVQRGLDAASDMGTGDAVGLFLLLGAGIGLPLAVAAWVVLPRMDTEFADAPAAEPLPVQDSERISWSRTVRLGGVASAVVAGALLLMVATVVSTAIASSHGLWIAVGVLVLVLLLVLATTTWRVSADRRGLIVRSGLGWPRVVIPADDISQVSVLTVNAAADFGGWGWRWDAAGRRGIIMHSGPAIQVTRRSGKRFVVTVPDAETGASVLAAVVAASARQASAGHPLN